MVKISDERSRGWHFKLSCELVVAEVKIVQQEICNNIFCTSQVLAVPHSLSLEGLSSNESCNGKVLQCVALLKLDLWSQLVMEELSVIPTKQTFGSAFSMAQAVVMVVARNLRLLMVKIPTNEGGRVDGVVDGDAPDCGVKELEPEEEVITDGLLQWCVVCFDACTVVADTIQEVLTVWNDVTNVGDGDFPDTQQPIDVDEGFFECAFCSEFVEA
eukprot:15365522-Ditylum_brightwellii.AAC.2